MKKLSKQTGGFSSKTHNTFGLKNTCSFLFEIRVVVTCEVSTQDLFSPVLRLDCLESASPPKTLKSYLRVLFSSVREPKRLDHSPDL